MSETIKVLVHYTALFLEAVAVLFIITGAVGSIIIYIKRGVLLNTNYLGITQSRNHLGHTLSLSLEFLIGADILKTAISPTWEDIGQLAAIVGIRTILNFFLTKELKQME